MVVYEVNTKVPECRWFSIQVNDEFRYILSSWLSKGLVLLLKHA